MLVQVHVGLLSATMANTLEQPKKPAGGGYGQFMSEKRAEFTKQCAGQPVSAVTKLGGEKWKAMTDAEKEPYNKAFEEAKKKYAVAMEEFLAAGGVKQKGAAALRSERRKEKEGKSKKNKDPDAPKKPAGGAYGCYLAAHRAEFQKACPGSITGVAKLAGEKWKALPEAEKEQYQKEYETKLATYKEAMKSYTPPTPKEGEEPAEPPAKKHRASKEEKDAEKEAKKSEKEAAKAKKDEAKAAKVNARDAKAKAKSVGKFGRGMGAKAKQLEAAKPEIPASVQAKAEKAGLVDKLMNLLSRDDIKGAGTSASNALGALEEAGGLLHPAKRALLGA